MPASFIKQTFIDYTHNYLSITKKTAKIIFYYILFAIFITVISFLSFRKLILIALKVLFIIPVLFWISVSVLIIIFLLEKIEKKYVVYLIIGFLIIIIIKLDKFAFIFNIIKKIYTIIGLIHEAMLILSIVINTPKMLKQILELIIAEIYEKGREKINPGLEVKYEFCEKLVDLCLSEEKNNEENKYVKLVKVFSTRDLKKLFKGDFECDNDDEITYFCDKYHIKDIEDFKSLISKFQNFQVIFAEWYDEESKHEYLKNLWICYPIMHKLKDLDEKDLAKRLEKANYSKWNQYDKNTFKDCINNSPEIKAAKFNDYFEQNFNEFYSIYNICVKFHYSFKNNKYMKEYKFQSYTFLKKIINIFSKGYNIDKELYYKSNSFKNVLEKRVLDIIIKNHSIEAGNENYYYYIIQMIKTMKNRKIDAFINKNIKILSELKSLIFFYYLIYNIMALIAIIDFIEEENEKIRLYNDVINTFINHISDIKNISEDYEKNIRLIKSILLKINTDRNNIFELLLSKINTSIKYEEGEKSRNYKDLVKGIVKTGLFSAGSFLSGGILTPVFGAAAITSGANAYGSGSRITDNKKTILEKKELLIEFEKRKTEVENQIKSVKLLFESCRLFSNIK